MAGYHKHSASEIKADALENYILLTIPGLGSKALTEDETHWLIIQLGAALKVSKTTEQIRKGRK